MRAEHNTMCVEEPAQLSNLQNLYTEGKLTVTETQFRSDVERLCSWFLFRECLTTEHFIVTAQKRVKHLLSNNHKKVKC